MKRLFLLMLLLLNIIIISNVSAIGYTMVNDGCTITNNGTVETCAFVIDVDGPMQATAFTGVTVTLTNAEFQGFTAGNDWNVTIISQTSSVITFRAVYKGTSIPSGQTTVFSITVESHGTASDPCKIEIDCGSMSYFCKRIYQNGSYVYYNSHGQTVTESEYNEDCNPKCEYSNGNYYNSHGAIVTESEYNADCNPKCEYSNGVYYGPSGQIIGTEINWLTTCNSFVCQSYTGPSNTVYYFNKNGNPVTQSSMISSCSCTKVGNVYYKNNMVVATNEADMIIDCYSPVCRSYTGPSGTTYYFNKDGQRVSNAAAMNSSCGCREENGKYYDANNQVTNKLNYIISCQHPVCTSVDNYYFDSNGNSVTQANMLKSCFACKAEGGKYYDANGQETTKLNYIMSCQKPKCSSIDGYYFDKDGNNVTRSAMLKSCYACKEENGNYYNSDGEVTTKLNYIISCKNPKCTEYEGYYFDKNGNQVSDAIAVMESCDSPKCMKIDDNTYFDKNGNRVTSLEQYAKSCLTCQQYEDKYITKNGSITTDINEYIVSCHNPKCEVITINNKKYYYNNDGQLLNNEDEYNYYCTQHICKIIKINGETSYYDNEGNKTTEANYNATCKDKIICEEKISGGISIYYDKNGNQVSKTIYQQQCLLNSCKNVGDKYYDNNGKEISKLEYQQQCQVNKCEKIGDKYYDNNGKEVTKDDFDKACQSPNTGAWIPTITILLLALGGGVVYITKKKKVLFKI